MAKRVPLIQLKYVPYMYGTVKAGTGTIIERKNFLGSGLGKDKEDFHRAGMPDHSGNVSFHHQESSAAGRKEQEESHCLKWIC